MKKKSILYGQRGIWLATGISFMVLSLFIGEKFFWFDEQYSYFCTAFSWKALLDSLWNGEMNMGLYYIILKLWRYIGDSDVFIRMLSVLLAVAAVPLIYEIGKELFGRRVGIFSAWLLAVHPFMHSRAQEARGYTLALFLVCLSTFLFIRTIKKPTYMTAFLYGAASGLSVYAHFFASFVILVHAIYFIFIYKKIVKFKIFTVYFLTLVFFLIPFAAFIYEGPPNMTHWVKQMDWISIPGLFFRLSGGFTRVFFVEYVVFIFLIIIFLLFFKLIFYNIKKKKKIYFINEYIFMTLWIAFPIVAVSLIEVTHRHMFVIRYFFIILPAFIILLSACIVLIFKSNFLQESIISIIACCFITIPLYAHFVPEIKITKQYTPWSVKVSYFSKNAIDGDAVFFSPPRDIIPFYYHLNKIHLLKNIHYAYRNFKDAKPYLKTPQKEDISLISDNYDRIWLFSRIRSKKYFYMNNQIIDEMKIYYEDISFFKHINVYLFSK